jgi:hypothetical protein
MTIENESALERHTLAFLDRSLDQSEWTLLATLVPPFGFFAIALT